ncbi:hypothetical protein HPB49_022550 [Dermacentor silvarum]|uniref:Uncharacterized protein n=1 Tax=Dermacentor silvarum TaxID=543639 RepID=A0ACB8CBW8_DERSI|nr:hypothetical protein HPB49_022550 [Dermacentor silvarum]
MSPVAFSVQRSNLFEELRLRVRAKESEAEEELSPPQQTNSPARPRAITASGQRRSSALITASSGRVGKCAARTGTFGEFPVSTNGLSRRQLSTVMQLVNCESYHKQGLDKLFLNVGRQHFENGKQRRHNMRPTTLPSLCVFVALVLLSTEARPAHSALILPLIIFKKLPKHDPTQHLKSLLQFINVDVIKGLVGQLINFEAILRHFSPPAKTSTAASQTTVVMMMDEPRPPPETTTATSTALPTFPTLPPIPVTPEMEASPVRVCLRVRSYGCAPRNKLLVPVPLPLPLPIPIPLIKPKVLPLILPKLPRIGITLHLGKGSPLRHLRIHHKPKLVHLDHGHDDHDYHHSHSSHQPHHHHHGPPSHSGEDEVYEVKNQPPQYPSKDWKS